MRRGHLEFWGRFRFPVTESGLPLQGSGGDEWKEEQYKEQERRGGQGAEAWRPCPLASASCCQISQGFALRTSGPLES